MITFDFEGLLAVAAKLARIPDLIKRTMARVINNVGQAFVDAIADDIAVGSGLSKADVRAQIEVSEATEDNPIFEMDATRLIAPSLDWTRPWTARSDKPFEDNTLVKIVTMGDDRVCPICERAAANSPYTLSEIQKMLARWMHTLHPGLVHPRCRCVTQAWEMGGRSFVPMAYGSAAPAALMNVRKMGQFFCEEMRTKLKE